MRGIKIPGFKNLTMDKDIFVYDTPEYVYIPLVVATDEDVTLKTRKGSQVKIGQVLAVSNKFDLPILSSVSGTVEGYEEKYAYNGKLVKTIKIKNDFKDTYMPYEVKEIDKYNKKEFISILKDFGIRGMGGADFPAYIKYDTKGIKNLIINAVECEPYITADYVLLKDSASKILETIDAIMTIQKIPNAYIAIKKKNKELISKVKEYIGTYPKIKIVEVPDIYPMGWERNLVKYILHKKYDRLPSEVDTIVSNVSTINSIYYALKYGQAISSRIVTFAGDGLKKNLNVLVRVGTDISEVLDKLGHIKRDLILISGGAMLGRAVKDENITVTPNLNAILLIKDNNDEFINNCIRCGKCSSVCPTKLTPALIKDNLKDIDELKKLNVLKCVECGLCSYICPAKIQLRDYVVTAKEKVGGKS